MPTLLHIDGLRVATYPNDHAPAHVHVIGDGCEAVFDLNCPDGPVELRGNFRFRVPRLNRIQRALTEAVETLCLKWEAFHGHRRS